MGISYSEVQSLTCRDFPKTSSQILPRCRSYRLRKTQLMADPFDTLSFIVSQANNQNRTLYFSRVIITFLQFMRTVERIHMALLSSAW